MPDTYSKAFLPLESNPDVFNELIALLGAPPELAFEDIFTLDEPGLFPHPTLALVLVFPDTNNFGSRTTEVESARPDYAGRGDDEPVVWFKQTIHNACGLQAVLHALSNGEARRLLSRSHPFLICPFIIDNDKEPHSLLSQLLGKCIPLDPAARAEALEASTELETAHTSVAVKGDSAVPESADIEVEFHYICFVKSLKDSHVYELDGDWKGPIDTGVVLESGEDLLSAKGLRLVQDLITNSGGNINVNILALVKRETGG